MDSFRRAPGEVVGDQAGLDASAELGDLGQVFGIKTLGRAQRQTGGVQRDGIVSAMACRSSEMTPKPR